MVAKNSFFTHLLASCGLLLVFFSVPPSVEAAVLSLDPTRRVLAPGEEFEVAVLLDTEEEAVNALAGTISYPTDRLDVIRVSDGNSFVGLWLLRPTDYSDRGDVSFEGVIPGGYSGKNGRVVLITFRALEGETEPIRISFDDASSRVFLHDGQARPATLALRGAEYRLDSTRAPQALPAALDTDPPEDFRPEVARSPDTYAGKYFLVFATQDKGSGVSYYEVAESRRELPADALEWRRVESPHLLRDQKLYGFIFVKAVDGAGNARIVSLPPRGKPRYQRIFLYGTIAVILIWAALLLIFKIIKLLRKKRYSGR